MGRKGNFRLRLLGNLRPKQPPWLALELCTETPMSDCGEAGPTGCCETLHPEAEQSGGLGG
jgi:hypothetical protein